MKEKLDEIKFRVPKGQKEVYRAHAESMGEKLTPFIIRAINETMEHDKAKTSNSSKKNLQPAASQKE
jgi:hypothetical protein